jgi:hypothetical protein
MKVTLPDGYKYSYTVWELEQARQVIKIERDDGEKPEDICRRQLQRWINTHSTEHRFGSTEAIVITSITTVKNARLSYDRIADGTGQFDVEFDGYAVYLWGCVRFGFLLTDYWEHGDDYDSTEHMYTRVAEFPPFGA